MSLSCPKCRNLGLPTGMVRPPIATNGSWRCPDCGLQAVDQPDADRYGAQIGRATAGTVYERLNQRIQLGLPVDGVVWAGALGAAAAEGGWPVDDVLLVFVVAIGRVPGNVLGDNPLRQQASRIPAALRAALDAYGVTLTPKETAP